MDALELFEHDTPALPPGAYRITATLSLPNAVTCQFDRSYAQDFVVDAPQFTLPAGSVRSVFPPANANGEFGDCLPFVLLQPPTLPWERSARGDGPASAATEPVPWLAVLVLRDDELPPDPISGATTTIGTVRDLLSPAPGVHKPNITAWRLPAEALDSPVQSIRVPIDLFTAVAPRVAELSYLAHVREADTTGQADAAAASSAAFAVVIANRFPRAAGAAGARVTAHLISVEGLTDVLTAAPVWPGGTQHVDVVSLAQWSFASTHTTGTTFKELAGDLAKSSAGDPESLLLRIPVAKKQLAGEAADRLRRGYTALRYHTPVGPDMFAWYRGPFTAAPAQPLPAPSDPFRPSRLMIYDQRHGVFDHSYAAAWQIGRLVALADPAFVEAASRTKRRLQRLVQRLLDRAATPQLRDADLGERLRPDAFQRHFERRLDDGYAALVDGVAQDAAARAHRREAPLEPVPAVTPAQRRTAATALLDAAAVRIALDEPEVRGVLERELQDDDGGLGEWLGQLELLRDVPVNHLVPDQRMLPVECARFFYVDADWIAWLAHGATSTIVGTAYDEAVVRLMRTTAQARRPATALGPPQAGMLLRSALVSGWPSLVVRAWDDDDDELTPCTLRTLSDSVLLAIWDAVPARVKVAEPQQALAFGIRGDDQSVLRSIDPGKLGADLGPFPAQGTYDDLLRPVTGGMGEGVLQVFEPKGAPAAWLVPGLSAALGLSTGTYLTSAELGIELVQPRASVTFDGPQART